MSATSFDQGWGAGLGLRQLLELVSEHWFEKTWIHTPKFKLVCVSWLTCLNSQKLTGHTLMCNLMWFAAHLTASVSLSKDWIFASRMPRKTAFMLGCARYFKNTNNWADKKKKTLYMRLWLGCTPQPIRLVSLAHCTEQGKGLMCTPKERQRSDPQEQHLFCMSTASIPHPTVLALDRHGRLLQDVHVNKPTY